MRGRRARARSRAGSRRDRRRATSAPEHRRGEAVPAFAARQIEHPHAGADPMSVPEKPGAGAGQAQNGGQTHGGRSSVRATLEQITAQPADLLVIGGGITGAGVARDAAMRGHAHGAGRAAGLRGRYQLTLEPAGARRAALPRDRRPQARPRGESGARASCSASPRTWSGRCRSSSRCIAATGSPSGGSPRACGCTMRSRCSAMCGPTACWASARCSRRSRCSASAACSGAPDSTMPSATTHASPWRPSARRCITVRWSRTIPRSARSSAQPAGWSGRSSRTGSPVRARCSGRASW